MSETALHRRTVQVDCYDEGDETRVVSRLCDERPWAGSRSVLHDMELRLLVSLSDLRIVVAEAQMHAFPHEECPFIAPKFAQLEGLTITRGFTRALRESFAGVSGCQHLHELARVTGPAVFQARTSRRARLREAQRGAMSAPDDVARGLRDTCHIWSSDGPGPRKLQLGWRPGSTVYPVPSVERLGDARGGIRRASPP